MDLIPIADNQSYIICDRNLTVVQFSADAAKYATQAVRVGQDLLACLPEMVGLETTVTEILRGEQDSFTLEAILRDRQDGEGLYFNLVIQKIEQQIVIFLEDVTKSILLQQSSVQRLNELEITLNKLQRFEYCTNKIIASMQDVLLITSPLGIIERVNKSATELFKQPKSDLINQSIGDLITDPNYDHQEIYSSLLSSEDIVSKIEVSFTSKQSQTIQIEFDCFIAPTEVKDFFNCVYIGRDITARKQVEAEIRKSLSREKELRELKSGFISMASHEFRNPLSSILLCVQNLRENTLELDPANREFYLQSIQDSALTMNSLLEDILVLSKTESDKQTLKLEPIELRLFCQKIIHKLASLYANQTVNFEYRLAADIVNLDRVTLSNILNNLLSNALKYSPEKTVVNLIVTAQIEPPGITIEVSDRGIGIPQESQKHLFESFYRASNVSSFPGTGLGMSIVKKTVDLYQGSITVDSQVGQGTKIIVYLPIPIK
ncbi:MAG: PAS domain-containing sensor histidine kinase [Pleurocapsa sp. SU_5_0]|nr:PAS domain-containing sensor histidine kinase [Pleurocapsa sp. SU_5_0]